MKIDGRDDRTRTCGLAVPNRALYQLSYIPMEWWCEDATGLPVTVLARSVLFLPCSRKRSQIQRSYVPTGTDGTHGCGAWPGIPGLAPDFTTADALAGARNGHPEIGNPLPQGISGSQ